MLDADLAEIYGYTTSAFNQQVIRNIEKFEGEDFMVQLDYEEFEGLMSQNVISSWGGTRKMPYAFTEQGIYMLMTVLRGPLAVKQSRALIRMFKTVKDYIVENQDRIEYKNNLQLAMRVMDNAQNINKMKDEVNRLDGEMNEVNKKLGEVVRKSDISPILLDFTKAPEQKEYVFLNGEPMKASELYIDIYSNAKKSIYIIDNYIR